MTIQILDIPLANAPNQQLSFTANDLVFDLRITSRDTQLYMDIAVEGETVQTTARCIANQDICYYQQYKLQGNFRFEQIGTADEAPLISDNFNTEWSLIYYYDDSNS